MFSNIVPVFYLYLLCIAACPGVLAERPWEQRLKYVETELQRVSQLLDHCSTKTELNDVRGDMTDMIEEFAADINNKVDDVARGIATNMSDVIDDIREEITDVKESTVSMTDIGTSYIRWGRNTCPLGEDRVYSGIMSGTHSGFHSGVNYQCLPLDPEYANYLDGAQNDGGRMYGAEYGGHPDDIFDLDNLVGSTFVNQDVPCSLCHVTNRTTVQMFPGQTQCPLDWTREYWGYLVSSYYGQGGDAGQTTFECVDNAPEVFFDGVAGEDSATIYNVETQCGVLPCPGYVQGWELTCVVCTK